MAHCGMTSRLPGARQENGGSSECCGELQKQKQAKTSCQEEALVEHEVDD